MENRKFVYVILHYNTMEDTQACVHSLLEKLQGQPFEIVIVDNCSPNGSGEQLLQTYDQQEGIHVILNERNLGFAQGNNVGFRYAKHELKADFIVLMNNDTLLLQEDTQALITQEYETSRCALIGPKVNTPHPPFDSNPGTSHLPTLRHELGQQFVIYFYWFWSLFGLDPLMQKIFGRHQQRRLKRAAQKGVVDEREENVQLHGCFWAFTPAYVQRYDGINDKTFLYGEEALLYVRCKRAGLKTIYLPALQIFHQEDSASDSIHFTKAVKKRRFFYRHWTHSRWVLIRELLHAKD